MSGNEAHKEIENTASPPVHGAAQAPDRDRYEPLIPAVVFALVFIAYCYGAFESLEARLIDHRFLQRKLVDRFEKIAVVEITDSCLGKVSGWPVSRSIMAAAVDRVMKGGAKTLAVDILFDNRTLEQDDVKLAEAIRRHADSIVLAARIDDTRTMDEARNMVTTRRTVLPYLSEDARFRGLPFRPAFMNVRLAEKNPDRTAREVVLSDGLNALGLEAFMKHSGTGSSAGGPLPAAAGKPFFVSYYNTYAKSPFVKVAFSDLLAMDTDEVGDILAGKLVFMGATANSAGDFYITPLGDMPGVEIHATIAANMMEGRMARRVPAAVNFLILLAALALVHLYLVKIKVWFDPLALVLVLSGNYFAAVHLATGHNIFTDMVPLSVQVFVQIFAFRLYRNVRVLYLLNIQLGSRNRELSLMDLINHAIINKTGGELLCEILNIVVNSIKSERSSILMMAESENKLMLKYVFSNRDAAPVMVKEYISFNVGEGIAGTVAERGDMMISNDVKSDERFKMYSQAEMNKTVDNLACIALKSDKEIFGVLNIVNKLGGFTDEDMVLLQNIADQVAVALQNAKFYELAITDGMTKLYIHRYFQSRLDEEMKRSARYGTKLSLILFDVDHFKKFNDTYGHQQGDIVLIETAKIVKDSIRLNIDIACRYGGEEFTIIMPETDAQGARVLAERLRKRVEAFEYPGQEKPLHVTISLGVAVFPDDATDKQMLIKRSDDALYRAKEAGRNNTQIYSEVFSEGDSEKK